MSELIGGVVIFVGRRPPGQCLPNMDCSSPTISSVRPFELSPFPLLSTCQPFFFSLCVRVLRLWLVILAGLKLMGAANSLDRLCATLSALPAGRTEYMVGLELFAFAQAFRSIDRLRFFESAHPPSRCFSFSLFHWRFCACHWLNRRIRATPPVLATISQGNLCHRTRLPAVRVRVHGISCPVVDQSVCVVFCLQM